MILSRRIAIKYLAMGTAGYVFVSSCNGNDKQPLQKASLNLNLSALDETSVALLCNTLLPLKSIGGEMEKTGLYPFVLKMVDECQSPENRQKFRNGLQLFRKKAENSTGHSIEKVSASQLIPVLKELEEQKESGSDLYYFYHLTKSLTIQGYQGSKFYLTQVMPYKLVPGKYEGCS